MKQLLEKWQLHTLRLFPHLSHTQNYVAIAYSNLYKKDVVLKICSSDFVEQKLLSHFDGKGCVQLLDFDEESRALLLEYIQPGTQLKKMFSVDEKQPVVIAARLIQKLHVGKNLSSDVQGCPTMHEWVQILTTFTSSQIPQELVQKAQKIAAHLLATQSELFLLHGDLHHENIIQSGDGWVVIDPQGVVGELACEVTAFIRNPIPELLQHDNAKNIIRDRINLFSDFLGVDSKRIVGWSFVQAIICGMWAEQDGLDSVDYFVQIARGVLVD